MEAPKELLRYLKKEMPSHTIIKDSGRRLGITVDYDDYHAGYECICIYVQLGLENYQAVIYEIFKIIRYIQKDYLSETIIIPASFGNCSELITRGKYFRSYLPIAESKKEKILTELDELSKLQTCDVPAIFPKLYPKPSARAFYYGKTKFENNDLMFIIGRKDEVLFGANLEFGISKTIRKRIIFAEIDNDNVIWHYKNYEPHYELTNVVE